MSSTPSPLAFVTVVYDAEVELLGLQARSFDRHLPPDAVREIVVVDNCRRGLAGPEQDRLVASYGHHRSAVSVVRPRSLGMGREGSGWRRQQALKLLAVRTVSTDHAVVLDAKNHLVRTFHRDHVVAPDGRPRLPVHGYRNHPLRHELVRVLAYAGLEPNEHVDRYTSTIPPFGLRTADVRDLIAAVESRAGRPFGVELVTRGLTEFFLCTAWQLRQGRTLAEITEPLDATSPTLWPSDTSAERVSRVVAQAAKHAGPFLAVHRRALAAAEPEALATLRAFWVETGLFGDAAEAEAFTARAVRQIRRETRVQKVLDLPARATARARRLVEAAG